MIASFLLRGHSFIQKGRHCNFCTLLLCHCLFSLFGYDNPSPPLCHRVKKQRFVKAKNAKIEYNKMQKVLKLKKYGCDVTICAYPFPLMSPIVTISDTPSPGDVLFE